MIFCAFFWYIFHLGGVLSVEDRIMPYRRKRKKKKGSLWEPSGGIKSPDARDTEVSRKYMVADRLREITPSSDPSAKDWK